MLALEKGLFSSYFNSELFDEMVSSPDGVREHYQVFNKYISQMSIEKLNLRHKKMQEYMVKQGITFTLYNQQQEEPLERTIPFDMIPRIISAKEWGVFEKGLKQRVEALNLFLWDVYHEQRILHDGLIPRKMIVRNPYFRPEMVGLKTPNGVYAHISGIDIIRDEKGDFFVLEDNLRTPSGISYLYKNRELMKHSFHDVYFDYHIKEIDHGLNVMLSTFRSLSPNHKDHPVVVLLTPGSYNSAYFEHTFLAQEMGIDLVEGRDLVVIDHKVYMKGIKGLTQVDVIYRRIDDDFLDPLAFRPDSLLGVPGLMNAYRAGNVAIANAPGNGVADDKAVYSYVPDIIRYYLGEEPILNNVKTFILSRKEDRKYVLENLHKLVVKETSLSGGYGMLVGPCATKKEIAAFKEKILMDPDRYIAQPTISLSTAPSFINNEIVPRHIDLRAFIMTGSEINVLPGGLTRVALKEGSLVVNSSQGGGSKDTWVLS